VYGNRKGAFKRYYAITAICCSFCGSICCAGACACPNIDVRPIWWGVEAVVARIRQRGAVKICCAATRFLREKLMAWCEREEWILFGLAQNAG